MIIIIMKLALSVALSYQFRIFISLHTFFPVDFLLFILPILSSVPFLSFKLVFFHRLLRLLS